jgi:ATP-dependent Zn protease
MKNRELYQDGYTAFHEAGHAVIAYALGRRFRSITILPNKKRGYEGCMKLDKSRFNI